MAIGDHSLRPPKTRAQRLLGLCRYFSFSALAEVFVINLISLIPLGAIGLIAAEKSKTSGSIFEVLGIVLLSVSGGQLFLYCFSSLASVLWIVWDSGARPIRILIGPIALMLLVYTTLLLGVDPQMVSLTNPSIIKSSFYVYTIGVLLHFFVLSVSKASPPSIEYTLETEASALNSRVDELMKDSPNG
jgi:hypothetical protein